MIEPSLSPDEPHRLAALRKLNQLDTPLEERFERITRLAQRLLGVPIAAISMVDADRQWFKSIQGLNVEQTSRSISFCGHTILQDDPLHIPDARVDLRFHDNPLVTGAPGIVFYLGFPIRASDGSKVAALCAIDRKPHPLSEEDYQILLDLAAMAEREFARESDSLDSGTLLSEEEVVRRRTEIDRLTRLWNRDAITSLLNVRVPQASETGQNVGVILVEIDGFEGLCKAHGDAAGDDVLREVGKRVLAAARSVDAVGRLARSEFLVVLGPCDNLVVAAVVAAAIRERVARSPIAIDGGSVQVSVSLGVVLCEELENVDEPALLHAAGASLSRARLAGHGGLDAVMFEAPRRAAAA